MQLELFDRPDRAEELYHPPLLRSPGMVHRFEMRILYAETTGDLRVAIEWGDDGTRELIGWVLHPTMTYDNGGREQLREAWERLQAWLLTAQDPF